MHSFILRRFLHMIPLLLGISIISFLIIQVAPGDYLSQMKMNPQISPEKIEVMKEKFGLDKPWYIQYFKWLANAVKLDFGTSFQYQIPVNELIKSRMFNTFILSLAALIFSWLIAIPLGIIAAVRQNTWIDRASGLISFLGQSISEILLALGLLFFATITRWFPTGGMQSVNYEFLDWPHKILDLLHHLALPTIALGAFSVAYLMRYMRSQLLDTLHLEFVTTARAKGLSERVVIFKHALRNAINPLVTLLGFEIAGLLHGAFIVENIMAWPGLGRLTMEALFAQDLYLVMGALMMSAFLLLLGNLLADIFLALVDPRIRLE